MARDRIAGITIEIGGDTSKLNKALEGTNKEIRSTQAQLKDVEKLLKLDPKNTTLLQQRQELLAKAISTTKDKLDKLNEANDAIKDNVKNYDAWKAKFDPIQSELTKTRAKAKELTTQLKTLEESGEVDTDEYKRLQAELKETNDHAKELKKSAEAVNEEFGNPVSTEQYDALQREIIDTEHELKKLEDAAKQSNTTLAKIGATAQEISDKTGMLAEKTRGLSTAAATALTAIGAGAYKSVQAFAEYEQLVGGAKLAFGDAYNFIEERSKEAYRTVQMSQSDYLAQVNKLSIGLREALGGDQKAAAELADRVLTAEADVVAATGNSQEAVQNAFNGIMKSSYVMLDNLQLGIKPTKEGFQEVIDKVNEWNAANGRATEYQIDNLADCQNALVDYVEMQGLAGRAAVEANDTVKGSYDSVKAALENWLLEFSKADGDVEAATQAVLETVKNFAGQIVQVLETIWNNLPDWAQIGIAVLGLIAAISPLLSIISAVSGAISTLMTILPMLGTALTFLTGPVGIAIAAGAALVAAFVILWNKCEGFRNFWIELWEKIKSAFQQFINWITPTLKPLGNAISGTFKEAWNVIKAVWALVQPYFASIWNGIKAIFSAVKPYISGEFKVAWELIKGVWSAATGYFTAIWNTIKGIFSVVKSVLSGDFRGAWEAIKGIFASWGSYWSGLVNTIRNTFAGVKNALTAPINAAKSQIQAAVNSIKSFFANAKLQFPKIKLPHFTISGKFSLDPPSIPKLGVSWYAKAMNNAMLLSSPTIFGMMGGRLLGGGEAGTEIVAGAQTLMNMIKTAMSDTLQTPPTSATSVVRHTGTIRIEGVNNRGEFVAAGNAVLSNLGISGLTKLVMEEMQYETERREAAL